MHGFLKSTVCPLRDVDGLSDLSDLLGQSHALRKVSPQLVHHLRAPALQLRTPASWLDSVGSGGAAPKDVANAVMLAAVR